MERDDGFDADNVDFAGMTGGGDHGGETRDEVDAALFAYTPAGFGHPPASALGLGFGTADGMGTMYQTDLVPTLALALGVPIPFGNLGGALTELILPPRGAGDGGDEENLQWHGWTIVALHANARQVWRYLERYQATSSAFPPELLAAFGKRFAAIDAEFAALGLIVPNKITSKLEYSTIPDGDMPRRHHELALQLAGFLRDVAAFCRERFATFDLGDMVIGLLWMAAPLTAMVVAGIATLCVSVSSVFPAAGMQRARRRELEVPNSPMQTFVAGSLSASVGELRLGELAMKNVHEKQAKPAGSAILDCTLGVLGLVGTLVCLGASDGLSRGCCLGGIAAVASCSTRHVIGPAMGRFSKMASKLTLCGGTVGVSLAGQWQLEQTVGASVIIVVHAVSCLSNSFVDAEPEVIRYMLSSAVVVFIVRRAYALQGQQRKHALKLAIMLLLVIRVAPALTVHAAHEKAEAIATRRVEGFMPTEISEEVVHQFIGSKTWRWFVTGAEVLGFMWLRNQRDQTQRIGAPVDQQAKASSSAVEPEHEIQFAQWTRRLHWMQTSSPNISVQFVAVCVAWLAVLGYWVELAVNTRHVNVPGMGTETVTNSSSGDFDGVGGLGWHLLLPRVGYVAILTGLVSLAVRHCRGSGGVKTTSARLGWSLALLGLLDCLLLGPMSPPALASMGIQLWLMLQLRDCLRNTVTDAPNSASHDDGGVTTLHLPGAPDLSKTPPPSPPRGVVMHLLMNNPLTKVSGAGPAPSPMYGEVALFTALWLLSGRQYFFVTGHTNAFAKIDVGAPFVGFQDVHSDFAKLRSVLLVAYNTFGTQIMAWLSCPLLSTVAIHPEGAAGPEKLDHAFTALLCLIWQGIPAVFASICAMVHRRHLMMWAIFAPKFCFEAISLYVCSGLLMAMLGWGYASSRFGGQQGGGGGVGPSAIEKRRE